MEERFRVLLADPPWHYKNWSPKGTEKSATRHYPCMELEDIKDLPVADLATDDSVLFLWVINTMLQQGLDVMKAWRFEFKTVAFTWVKMNKTMPGASMGCGYWTRQNAEMCLLGTRGKPKRKFKDVHSIIMAQRREHSRKPDQIYDRIERLLDGPYCELFARHRRPGWTALGNDVEGQDCPLPTRTEGKK
ncbi:Uncharacterised protein [uncultured archaeon]|nr:Uncharacterised protein [uncultured archaeon]